MTIVASVSWVKKSFIEIEYDSQNNWLYINWIGSATKEMVMEGCEDVIQALHQYRVQKILNDNRNIKGSWEEGVEWVLNFWFPRFLGVGCFYLAWVQSSCPESQASLEQALQYEIPNITILVFDELETATAWLKEV